MSNKTTLEINLNEEYKIKIENGNQFDQSIFKDVYKAALINIIEIVKQFEKDKDSKYDDFNNIISFIGERGKGKSSSMISFRDALVNKGENEHVSFFIKEEELKNKLFAEIDIIDPSLFKGESLFEIILAKMFQKFQTQIKISDNRICQEDRRVIIKHFQEVYENLKIINSDRKDIYKKESIEALSNLATSSNLKQCFKDLVSNYLKNFEKGKNFLIIAIDDFDLNISGAYDMLEDIRQFLIQSNIIILISCKMEQLEDSITNQLCSEYSSYSRVLSNERNLKISNDLEINRYPKVNQVLEYGNRESLLYTIRFSANKYLEKIFPLHRKISLPELLIKDARSIIYIGDNNKIASIRLDEIEQSKNDELRMELHSSNQLFIGNNLSITISEIIYKKSGLFINSPALRKNSFFPDNFRSILNLLSIFKKNNICDELLRYTVQLSKNKLSYEYAELFISLENQSIETLNIALVNSIGKLKDEFNDLNLNYILFATNPLNVNIGDVYAVLNALNNQVNYTNKVQILFIDLLNIYYSLRIMNFKRTDENFYSFFNSGSVQLFRQSLTRKFRDYIYFEGLNIKNYFDTNILSTDDKLWFMHYFVIFGKSNLKYRDELESPFFKSFQGVSNGLFSPFAIFSNILFPSKLLDNMNIKNKENVPLYNQILSWNTDSKNLNNLFKNSMFYLEFLSIFDRETRIAHKSEGMNKSEQGGEIYFDLMYDYFTISLEKTLVILDNKYPFLDIDHKWWIENHPIINHWRLISLDENKYTLFKDVFQSIYNSQGKKQLKQEDIDLANKLISDYNTYFKSDQNFTSNGAKRAMNTVVKSFIDNKEVFDQLTLHRKFMDNNLNDGLSRIHSLLKSLADG